MQDLHLVTEDQAVWLRILETREYEGSSDRIEIPDEVVNALRANEPQQEGRRTLPRGSRTRSRL